MLTLRTTSRMLMRRRLHHLATNRSPCSIMECSKTPKSRCRPYSRHSRTSTATNPVALLCPLFTPTAPPVAETLPIPQLVVPVPITPRSISLISPPTNSPRPRTRARTVTLHIHTLPCPTGPLPPLLRSLHPRRPPSALRSLQITVQDSPLNIHPHRKTETGPRHRLTLSDPIRLRANSLARRSSMKKAYVMLPLAQHLTCHIIPIIRVRSCSRVRRASRDKIGAVPSRLASKTSGLFRPTRTLYCRQARRRTIKPHLP
jgi:hypothetical protein